MTTMIFDEQIADGVNPALPGLYEWTIADVGCYVGKYTSPSRPRRKYSNNVTRLLTGKPYRRGKPDSFRAIHRALAEAVRHGQTITLTFLENVADKAARHQREGAWIARRQAEAAAGGLPVLNG